MNPEFVRVLDFQDGLVCIFHYEFASNFNLSGKTTRHKPDRPPYGIASAPSRYDPEPMRVLLRPPVSDFLRGKVMKHDW